MEANFLVPLQMIKDEHNSILLRHSTANTVKWIGKARVLSFISPSDKKVQLLANAPGIRQ